MDKHVEKTYIYDKDKVNELIDRWSKGELLIDLLKEYDIARATLYVWAMSDIDGLKERYRQASLDHDKAMMEKLSNFYLRTDLVYFDDRGRSDTSRIRLAIEGTEKYLKLRSKYLLDKPDFQKLDLDISHCKTAKDVEEILKIHAQELTKTQFDMLLNLHQAMIKAEEHSEIKEKLELALDKLNKLQEGKE